MAGGIHANRWRNYIADIFRVLRPGGWCQMVEIYFNAQSDNGTLTDSRLSSPNVVRIFDVWLTRVFSVCVDHALRVWSRTYLQSLQPYKDPRAAMQLQNLMTQAGFVEVEVRQVSLPLSGWSTSKQLCLNNSDCILHGG